MVERKIQIMDDIAKEVAAQKGVKIEQEMGEAHCMVAGRLSQSAKPFKEILDEIIGENGFNKEKVADFHKRVTIAWGHHSIEQHSTTTLAFENISILSTNKYFENKRLSAYLERSTRYQDFSKPTYYTPKELNEEQKKIYKEAVENLFTAYSKILPLIISEIAENYKQRGIVTDEKNIKKKAFDCARYILPASAYTNFAMSANPQQFRSLIHDLLTEDNAELRESAIEMQKELQKEYPSLLAEEFCVADPTRKTHKNDNKKIKPITFEGKEKIIVDEFEFENIQPTVKLINSTQNAEELVIYEYLIKEGFDATYTNGKVTLNGKKISFEEKEKLIEKIFSYNTIEKKPHRAAENAHYWFETIVDFGAGRDLHRNRMLTWIDSVISPEYGYAIPYYLTEEAKKEYILALTKSFESWVKLVKSGAQKEIAQYLLPLATNYKVFYNLNAKEAHHVAKTRTSRAAHYSYREYVHQMVEEIKKINPTIGKQMPDQYEKEC